MSEMFRDLDNLTHCLADWNVYLIAHFKNKAVELNDTQKQLFQGNDQTKYLQQQLEKLQLEETQNVQRDESANQDIQSLQMTLMQKDREMKDAYSREEKLHRQNQKIRSQLDTLLKEQEKLVMQVLDLMKEKEQLVKDNKAN